MNRKATHAHVELIQLMSLYINDYDIAIKCNIRLYRFVKMLLPCSTATKIQNLNLLYTIHECNCKCIIAGCVLHYTLGSIV